MRATRGSSTRLRMGQGNGNNFEHPDLVSGQKVAVGHRTVDEWFNPNAFTEATGRYGDIPRSRTVG